jgi:hypothetical protein
VIEINTTFPDYVTLVESLAEDHLVFIADRLQLTGEKPFTWAACLTVYGTQEAFQLWTSKSRKYPELTLPERMVMLALEECAGTVTHSGTIFIDTFDGQCREFWVDVPPSTLTSLAERGLIMPSSDGHDWLCVTDETLPEI